MTTSNDFRNGMIIKIDEKLMSIVEFLHVKPGKGNAFVRTKIKNILTGQVIEKTFRGGEKVNEVVVEARMMEYLYPDLPNYCFMDGETYEQILISETLISNTMKFLKQNTRVKILFYKENPIIVESPTFVELDVTDTEPGVKGDTVSNVTKPAILETGLEINVPLFIEKGDIIKVDTRKCEYVERIRK